MRMIKLKERYRNFFEHGLGAGAQNKDLGLGQTASTAGDHSNATTQMEYKAFLDGFEIGGKYAAEWREGKDVLRCAIKNGDVLPADFYLEETQP